MKKGSCIFRAGKIVHTMENLYGRGLCTLEVHRLTSEVLHWTSELLFWNSEVIHLTSEVR